MINLTQHKSSKEQACHDLKGLDLDALKNNLTFANLPTRGEIRSRAESIASLAKEISEVTGLTDCMIGGAPFLMSELEAALREVGLTPQYAFSRRESFDELQSDGSVKKVAVFKHIGFISP